jgi:chemosensory pili system protein ChpC
MRAPQRIEAKKVQEIASLLIPLREQLLLLPNVSVAEIVPVSQVTSVADAPEWYLGNCIWREQQVPLISFEALTGGAKAGSSNRTRFAVLNCTGLSDDLPFIAIVAQGLPRLARVNEEEISERETDRKPYEFMHVAWAGEEATIPDLSAIEQAFLDYRANSFS